jgi:hypothetical protein
MSEQRTPDAGLAREGIVYSCVGQSYTAEAIRSARSSMRHNQLAHLLFSSEPVADGSGLLVERFEPSANAYADKIANMRRSPFERTIYLDTDTFVVAEIAHLLRLLDCFDLAVAHEPSHRGRGDPQVPLAFYEFNTGVIAWRASERMSAFMHDWQQTYEAWLEDEPFAGAGVPSARRRASRRARVDPSWGGAADQPAFRRCAWEHKLRICVLGPEYNFRLGVPLTVVESVRVIHGRHRNFERLAGRINERQNPRQFPRREPLRTRLSRALRRLRTSTRRRPLAVTQISEPGDGAQSSPASGEVAIVADPTCQYSLPQNVDE